MAHPWIFESTFEQGTNGEWDSETDTGSKLDFPHYSELARIPDLSAPYRGAYCMRVDLTSGDANEHSVTEGDINIADAGTAYFRWYMYISPSFDATADDIWNIFELQQAGGTIEQSVGMQYTASTDVLEIGVGDGTAPTSFSEITDLKGKWICIEVLSTISTGGSGAIQVFVDGTSRVNLTSLTQAAAVGQGVLGVQDQLATTTGVILFDDFVMDDARLYPNRYRWPKQMTVTKSQHVFVGPGAINSATLLSTGASNKVVLYDTDTGNTENDEELVVELDLNTHTSATGPFDFKRGCYAELSGTDPRVQVIVAGARDEAGPSGPLLQSDGMIRRYGLLRKPRPQNV